LLVFLIMVGMIVLALLVTWYSYVKDKDKEEGGRTPERQPGLVERLKLREIEVPFGGSQLEIPTDESLREADKAKASLRQNLSLLGEAAVKAGELDEGMLEAGKGLSGFGKGGRTREIGGDPSGKLPRWEVRFDKTSLDGYARQLDFFHIELAVLLPDGKVAYASNLTKLKPDTRIVGPPHEDEKRYYLTWRRGELQKADRELLARAGIDAGDGLILKFLSPQLESHLTALEKSHAASKAEVVERTRFGVRAEENGYAFYVLEQTYYNLQ